MIFQSLDRKKMSSITRSVAQMASEKTKFVNITTPMYLDSLIGSWVPIPFSYKNGVLDIHIQDRVTTDCISSYGAFNTTNTQHAPTMYRVKLMGKTGLVSSLGSNFLNWLSAYIDEVYGGQSLVRAKIVSNCQVTKVQSVENYNGDYLEYVHSYTEAYEVDPELRATSSTLGSGGVIAASYAAPSSDDYIYNGSEDDGYRSSYVFKTPLTLECKTSGDTLYLTLSTVFESAFPFTPRVVIP
jgi:hypothetical protein